MKSMFAPLNSVNRTRPIEFVVIHYTATHNLATAFSALKRQNLSAHALVPGPFCHLYPFTSIFRNSPQDPLPDWVECVKPDRVAMHCAGSLWAGTRQTNSHSYGIEITNLGYMTHNTLMPNLQRWEPQGEPGTHLFTRREQNVQVITRRPMTEHQGKYWEPFSQKQYETVAEITANVINSNNLTADAIIGHDHIDKNKSDPGPMWDWQYFLNILWSKLTKETQERTSQNTPLQIRYAQSHLNRLLNSNLTVDGQLGPRTISTLNQAKEKFKLHNTVGYGVNIPWSISGFNFAALSL